MYNCCHSLYLLHPGSNKCILACVCLFGFEYVYTFVQLRRHSAPKSYTVAKAHALFTSSLYTCMCWKWHKAGLHCITLQLQLDAIQWPCLFPYDSQWLWNTSNGYVIQNFSIYLIQSLNEYSCQLFSLKNQWQVCTHNLWHKSCSFRPQVMHDSQLTALENSHDG